MQQLRSRPAPRRDYPPPASRSSTSSPSSSASLLDQLKLAGKTLGIMLAVLWGLEIVDELLLFGMTDLLGVHPRSLFGLVGIAFAPLLHADLYHLLSNTAGLLMFGTVILLWSRREFWAVTAAAWIVGGLGTWLVGANGVHLGFSGVVFGYLGYLLMRGWYERKPASVILSIVFAVGFGSMLTGAIPGLAGCGISWEGHLFGLLGGVLVARRFKATPKPSLAEMARR